MGFSIVAVSGAPLCSTRASHSAASLVTEPGPSGARASAVAVREVSSCSSWALVEMGKAAHSSVLAWRIPWTEKPGGLQSVGWQRVRPD